MRAICTGISGVNKKDYLDDLTYYAKRKCRKELEILDVGAFVEEEAKRLFQQSHIAISQSGIDRKVLDLPRSTLRQLNSIAWKSILNEVSKKGGNYIVSIHACFRWKKALTLALDTVYLDDYDPDFFILLKDKPSHIMDALERDPKWKGKLSEQEINAWQQEEIEATRILAGYRQKDWKDFEIGQLKEDVFEFLFPSEKRLQYNPEPKSNRYKSIYCTAISGTEARKYLKGFCSWAKTQKHHEIKLLDLAERIVKVAIKDKSSINRNNILTAEKESLDKWRAHALESIRDEQRTVGDCIILGHSCFRLNSEKEELLLAFDPDRELVKWCQLNPDIYVTFIDNILANKIRLSKENFERLTLSLREVSMWHDEERFFTRLIAENFRKPHYIIPIQESYETLYRIAFEKSYKRAYLSFPITEVMKKREKIRAKILKQKDKFKKTLQESYVIFDPLNIKDGMLRRLLDSSTEFPYSLDDYLTIFNVDNQGEINKEFKSLQIQKESKEKDHNEIFKVTNLGIKFKRSELEEVKDHINDQIVERDFHLIDQSNWVIVFYPVSDVSPGVMSEVIYGFSHGRDVFAYWFSEKFSPFLESYLTTSQICRDTTKLLEMLRQHAHS
jgi:adenylate kinase